MDIMEVSNFYLIGRMALAFVISSYSLPVKGKGMADRKENEMQVLQSVDYLRGLLGVNSGNISIENITNVLFAQKNLIIRTKNGNGSGLCQTNNRPTLVLVTDRRNFQNFLMYVYVSNPQNSTHALYVIFKNGDISVRDSNNYGSVNIGSEANVDYYIQCAIGL